MRAHIRQRIDNAQPVRRVRTTQRISDRERAAMTRLSAAGMSHGRIAAIFGVGNATVGEHIRAAKAQQPPTLLDDIDQIASLCERLLSETRKLRQRVDRDARGVEVKQ